MPIYTAYGLSIASDMVLAEFPELGADVPCDVRIHLEARAPFEPLPSGRWALEITPGRIVFRLDLLGVFVLEGGRTIRIRPTPTADMDLVRLYLIGTILALLLHQRGLLALHAGCAALGNHAVAFLGESGQGKSSLVAALQARGHTLVADDVAAVDFTSGQPLVVPAFPQLKLAPAAAEALGQPVESLALLHLEEEKRGYRPAEGFASEPIPLAAIYLLSYGAELAVEPLRPHEAMIELVRHSYPTRLLQSGGETHFLHSAQIVRHVPVYRLQRPYALGDLAAHAQFVEEHVAASAGLTAPAYSQERVRW